MAPRKKTASVHIPEDCMPRCGTCAFFEIEEKDDLGLCHRYPPSIVVVTDHPSSVLPMSEPSDWCGEYKRRTN